MRSNKLPEILVLLLTAVLVVAIFRRLSLSPVLGYLFAGAMIGPYGIQIAGKPVISDMESTQLLAEFGVVLLLFVIGLELSIERLKQMRKHVFGFGTAQLAITSVAIGFICYLLKLTPAQSIIIGGGLALSSTAVVLQILEEKGIQSTQLGRLSLANLILQDLAVAPLLFLVPMLNENSENIYQDLGLAMLKAGAVIAIMFVIGMRILRPIYHAVASLESPELFIALTLLIVLGLAYLTNYFGLSLALGAFVAGLLVAETEFRAQVETDILPFKGILMGLFFMTVGMTVDFQMFLDKGAILFLLAFSLMMLKAAIIAFLARVFGFRASVSLQSGLLLSQGSEFAFVLFGIASSGAIALINKEIAQMLIVVVTLSMALTPLATFVGERILKLRRKANKDSFQSDIIEMETADLNNHIIVCGYGRVGHTICRLLEAENYHNYIAIDSDPKHVHQGRREGAAVYYGRADRMDILKSLGIGRASMVVITMRSHNEAISAVIAIRKEYPDVPIIARAWDKPHAEELRNAGASMAMAEAFESSLLIGSAILNYIGISENEINRVMNKFRAQEYPVSLFNDLFHDAPEKH